MIITCQWAWVEDASACGAPARWLVQKGPMPWYACGRHLNPTCESLSGHGMGDHISLEITRLSQVSHPALPVPQPGLRFSPAQ